MAYYLPASSRPEPMSSDPQPAIEPVSMADLRVFWGPDICRLEYLIHLVDTGRIKDERLRPKSAT